MLPWVIILSATSLDGHITGFDANVDLYYELAAKMNADAVLMGSETVLKGFNANPGDIPEERVEDFQPRENDPDDQRPILVVPDSKGRIRIWSEVRRMPYIRDVIVLCSRSTPKEYFDFLDERYIPYMVVGYEQADLETALNELNLQFGVKLVRVDSGGVLNVALLRAGLVDEVHVMVHPTLVGMSQDSMYNAVLDFEKGNIPLKLVDVDKLDEGVVYLSYEVLK
ncbi:MAG: RibD family protein [Methanobacteriaceae archaeon]|nr:RibD family protein [Methanobacteriaceae archaeon]